nr:integumentary mucin C.1-like [Cherax quadricarinatus]
MATLVGSRRTRWSVVLSVLGVGWVVATSVTAFGMYMVACHNSVSAVSYGTRVDARESTSQASLDNPPDYESLIKAETPPPSFDEVHFYEHYTNTSTTTTIPTTTTNTIPNTTTPVTTSTPSYQLHYTPDTFAPHQPDHTDNTTLTSHKSEYTNEFFTATCTSHTSTSHKPGPIQDLAPIHVPCV